MGEVRSSGLALLRPRSLSGGSGRQLGYILELEAMSDYRYKFGNYQHIGGI